MSMSALADEPTQSDDEQAADEQKPPADVRAEQVEGTTPVAPPVAPVVKPKAGDISTHGYLRGGFGASNQKGRMTCFQLAIPGGLVSKYRLGNECEVWAELDIATVVYAGDDGTVSSVHFMPTVFIPTTYIGYSPTSTTSSPAQYTTSTGATLSFPNLYADIKGISWLNGGVAWAGNRYYKRESVYISDFFYWNPSGVGGGVEDINLGRDLRISYGVFAVDGEPSSADASSPPLPMQIDLGIRNDLQLRGIKPYQSGEFQVGFQYIADYSNNKDANGASVTHGGWGVTVQHVQQVLGGNNKLAFQYGKGGGTGFGTLSRFYYPDFSLYFGQSESRRRIVDVLTVQPAASFGAQVNAVWQHDDLGEAGTTQDWYSAGTRLGLAFTEHAKLLGEVGYDRVKKSNGSGPLWLAKFTVSPTIAAARGFWMRPELRLFYTWAVWNENARTATVDSGRLFTATNKLSGSTFGLQGEAMW
ncbi:MAG TPA: carbohydrate porin [Polyangia bacterium]|jgi:maltoporin